MNGSITTNQILQNNQCWWGKGKIWHKKGKQFTTNDAENANSQIKAWCNEKLPLDEFQKLRD